MQVSHTQEINAETHFNHKHGGGVWQQQVDRINSSSVLSGINTITTSLILCKAC